jgi:endonuclease/exonuclease/phosphatase family metal-dependent hydrolase
MFGSAEIEHVSTAFLSKWKRTAVQNSDLKELTDMTTRVVLTPVNALTVAKGFGNMETHLSEAAIELDDH